MNLVSWIIVAVIAAALIAAIRYTKKHGSCSCGSEGCKSGSCSGCAMKPIEEEQERKYMEEWSKKYPEMAGKK